MMYVILNICNLSRLRNHILQGENFSRCKLCKNSFRGGDKYLCGQHKKTCYNELKSRKQYMAIIPSPQVFICVMGCDEKFVGKQMDLMRHYSTVHTASELLQWSMEKFIIDCNLTDQPIPIDWIYRQFDTGQSEDELIDELRAYNIPVDQRYFVTRPGSLRDAMIEYGQAVVEEEERQKMQIS